MATDTPTTDPIDDDANRRAAECAVLVSEALETYRCTIVRVETFIDGKLETSEHKVRPLK